MDYLQYVLMIHSKPEIEPVRFKPCYKWITFNTDIASKNISLLVLGFKPCYKWITFNTINMDGEPTKKYVF